MSYSYNDEQKSSSADVHIDASKLSTQGGESIESFSWKVIARLEQLLGFFNSLATSGTVKNAENATTASKLSVNAGTEMKPVYFAEGIPVVCGETINANITGNASSATSAVSATNANYATSAGSANSATNASYATNAGNATNANYATSAGNANTLQGKSPNDFLSIATYGSNYVKFSNGLIIQWGQVYKGTTEFHIHFSQTCTAVACEFKSGSIGGATACKTTTTHITVDSSYGGSDISFNYIAIGF